MIDKKAPRIDCLEKFEHLKDALHANCPRCNNVLENVFAVGKLDEIITQGPKKFEEKSELEGDVLKLTRTFTLEETEITSVCKINLETNEVQVELTPSADELVEKFPIGESFSDFDATKYFYAVDSGMINIWRIYGRLVMNKMLVQSCSDHYRRVSVLDLDFDDDKMGPVYNFDEFHYVPTPHGDNELYVIHKNVSSGRTKIAYPIMFIGTVPKDKLEAVDIKKGGVFLDGATDSHLMNFDFSNPQRLGRKLQILSSMK